ncbi:MAG: murein biosynthesis integral membrane protein MurJ [Nibricoccus sp.]
MSKNLKNISVVASATMISRVLGLVRETLTAAVFGTSALASAYATAFQLPNLFRRLLAEGGMTAAFIPTLTEETEKRQRAGAFALISQVASWLLVASGAVVGLSILLLSQQNFIASAGRSFGAEPETIGRWLLAAKLAVILFPYLVFVCLAAAFSAALQTFNRFLEPALSPIWLNVAMIGFLATGAYITQVDLLKMKWFCAGVLLGGFLQMAVPAWALTREGWRPRFDLSWSEPVRAVVRLMGPTVLGSAVYLINMTVSRFVGLSLSDATVSVLNYAQRLMELPIGVFAVAVSTVVFPLITRHAARGDMEEMGDAYRKGMRLILIINVPAAAGLAALAEPVIRLLFQHGAFHASDTRLMVPVLIVYAWGLPFFSFVNLALRAFYAQKDTRTPVRAAVLSFFINLALSLALMGPLSTVGLALAGNVAIVVQAWYLQTKLERKAPQLAFHHLWGGLSKVLVASAVMGLVVYGGWILTRHWLPVSAGAAASAPAESASILGRLMRNAAEAGLLAAWIAAGVAIYGGLLWMLRIDGREEIVALVQKKFQRRRA